jgi:hypothetical protein
MNPITSSLNNYDYKHHAEKNHVEKISPLLKNHSNVMEKNVSLDRINPLSDFISNNPMVTYAGLGSLLLLASSRKKKPTPMPIHSPVAEFINIVTIPIITMIATLGIGLRLIRPNPEITLLHNQLKAYQKKYASNVLL